MFLKMLVLLACAAVIPGTVAVRSTAETAPADPPPEAPTSRRKSAEPAYQPDTAAGYADSPPPPPPKSRPRPRPSYDPYAEDPYYDPYPEPPRSSHSRYPASAEYDPYTLGGPERSSLYRRMRPGYGGMPSSLMAAYMMADMDLFPWLE